MSRKHVSVASMPSLGEAEYPGGHYQQQSHNRSGTNVHSGVSMPSLLVASSERENSVELESSGTKKEIDKRRRQTDTGKTIVTTPWYPAGTVKDAIKLCDEVNALCKLLELSEEEVAARHRFRSTLHETARDIWASVTVKVYGSFAYGLSLPGSALDVVVEGCTDLNDNFNTYVDMINNLGFKVEAKYCAPEEAFIKIRAGDIIANLSLVHKKSLARASVARIRSLIEQFPMAAPVFAAVRLLLQQSRCNNAADGGISSYAILIMILHTCREFNPLDAGQLLVAFFRQHQTDAKEVISAIAFDDMDHPKKDGSFWVADPLDKDNNVATGCTRIVQVRSVFGTSHVALGKWMSSRWNGYRGRSPLSSILAYGDLWDRAEA